MSSAHELLLKWKHFSRVVLTMVLYKFAIITTNVTEFEKPYSPKIQKDVLESSFKDACILSRDGSPKCRQVQTTGGSCVVQSGCSHLNVSGVLLVQPGP